MKSLSIIIPLYNQLIYTKQLWESILSHEFSEVDMLDVIFIDNGSTDNTSDWLKQLCDSPNNSRVIPHGLLFSDNLGFGPGINKGVEISLEKYPDADILLLNNDMELLPGCIDELVKTTTDFPNAAIIGGKLFFPDGRIQHAGAFLCTMGWGFHKGAGQHDDKYKDVTEPTNQEYVTGALFYIRNYFIKESKHNVFDEIFAPAYFEEVDLCYEAHLAGYDVMYNPKVTAIHYENVTGNAMSTPEDNAKSEMSNNNQQKFYQKHEHSDFSVDGPKLLINAKIYGNWSFSMVMRNLAKGLSRNGVDVSIAPEEYHQRENVEDWEIRRMILKPNDYWNRHVLRSSEGEHMYLMPPGKKRIAHTTGESDRASKQWIDQLNNVDLVLTTSNFFKDVLKGSGLRTQVEVLPNSVDTSIYHKDTIPMISVEKRRLNFVSVFHYGDRKAPEILIQAFARAFNSEDDVTLTIHSSSTLDAIKHQGMEVPDYILSVSGVLDRAPIYFTKGHVSDNDMPGLIKNFDVMVLPTRSEGFGLPLLEAAALGMPSITTGYSGVLDIVDNDTGWLIDHKIKNIPLQSLTYFSNFIGGNWAEPDVDHLETIFKNLYNMNIEDIKKKGDNALIKSAQFSIENVGKLGKNLIFGD